MAQTIKLRRSSTQGKVPTTSQLSLGEIAINTYDGRVFFEKNDGSATIQHIVTTDSITTGSVSIVGQLTVDDITINGSTISDGGDLTIDAGGDIILDADGTDIILKDGGTTFGRLKRSSSDFVVKSDSNNNNIIFKGVDNSATITALTLDMSDAGTAIFNNDVKVVGNISGSSFGGTGLISGAAQITAFGNLEIANPTITGTLVSEDVVRFTGLSSATEATSVMINGSNELVTRELGSNAFSSVDLTSFGTGSVTNLTVGTGLDVSTATTVPTITLDLSELTDMTGGVDSDETELILLDNGAESRKAIGEIALSHFSNDSGFLTSTGSNAQTVGGISAGSFLRSDATDTAGSKITFSGGLNMPDNAEIQLGTGNDFIIEDNGTDTLFKSTRHGGEVYFQNENASGTNQNTLILGTDTGNTSATYVELRYNNVQRIKTTSNGSDMAGLVNFDGTTQSTSKTTGTVVIDGGVGIAKTLNVGEDVVAYASSDERYKDLITPIENPNEKIKLLSGNTFVWNDKHEVFKGKKDIGVIAQEVEKVLPEIVETRDNGYKAVKYEKIVALLIESNKELIKRVEELEEKLK